MVFKDSLGASLRLVQAPAWCKPPLGASLRLVQAPAWCKPPLIKFYLIKGSIFL
jgi:hypothetical protein